MSCVRTKEGVAVLSVRPQLPEAWTAFFKEAGTRSTVQTGWMLNDELIMYPLMHMQGPDEEVVRAAKHHGFVPLGSKVLGKAFYKMLEYLIHGTLVSSFLNMCKDGTIRASR